MAFDSQHRVWTPLFNFNGQRNSVPFPLTPAAPSTALAAVGVQVTWPDAHVYRYRVYRDGALIATLAGQSYNDTAVAAGTHDYTISVGLADQVTWSPQSPASTISLSSGSLVFSQPPNYNFATGDAIIPLNEFVSGGNAQKWYIKMQGTLPKDVSLSTNTGSIGTAFLEVGSFSALIRVTDTIADAREADWIARSTATGVLWSHDFTSDAEVDKFVVSDGSGNFQYDENNVLAVRRITSDGVATAGCLELYCKAGSHNGTRWSRPFACLPGDRGYVSGADVNWRQGTNWNQYTRGMYGHPEYWSDTGATWDGSEFWLQFRYKGINVYDATHAFADPGGKLAYVDVCGGGNQEVIFQAPASSAGRVFRIYTNWGSRSNSGLDAYQGQNGRGAAVNEQPGGDYFCTYPGFANCWTYPDNEWVTFLLHVVPGHHNGSTYEPTMASTNNRKDTGLEVFAARAGATSYSKIYEKFDYVWNFDGQTIGARYGFNTFVASQFMNGALAGPAWVRRFDQVIFSTRYIECPRV